ncbi:alpha-mannosyl-glycoprotein 2-beta-n-acetylglucosaminyltransferase-like protein [Blastocystis sp. subtype 4]|uniref:alpha-mannosyl-glycoprotein 2-beta-n-acetylglucosaminyltransferase-like protein n=1 Tax=Blastocystis sp. subtype 4 TaxID=944170 RepID=UPI0007118598|nr:alpha-mannosyl-glycoprotein 2-beta-n-acetylglucosaminyltransferase-like protein [Blastocystis sp. subtype 4]KNB46034.1 alpha-mannosyl-glycoprotein 2-beta-n-acetylglucosaminyltransferase-like protein [Blastocystis sp. subtype 4]|eukprot:XP_014529477.1 alpha-mannosyl-glycoprotein 2-beta-n-acetylglucosaminyltransferase-like protein [Blastocystis sp. subtype 4]
MQTLFDGSGYQQILFIEEQYLISADFFSYFDNISPVMWKDPTILGITAFNENGAKSNKFLPFHVFRSDFMSMGAWLLTSKVWIRYDRKWCPHSMLKWIRLKENRKDQACIIPQVHMISRAVPFKLTDMNDNKAVIRMRKHSLYQGYYDFSTYNINYLLKKNYDRKWDRLIQSAKGPELIQMFPKISTDLVLISYLMIESFGTIAKKISLPAAKDNAFPTAYKHSYLTVYRNSWCIVTLNNQILANQTSG